MAEDGLMYLVSATDDPYTVYDLQLKRERKRGGLQVDTISEPLFQVVLNRPVDLINLNVPPVIIRLVIVERLGWPL